MRKLSRRLTEVIMKIDGIEGTIDAHSKTGGAELVLLYALDDGESHSQREISDNWEVPRTTINTIVKRWENEGVITLQKIAGKRREMSIQLTDKGLEKAKKALAYNYFAEDTALKSTIEVYGDTFIEAMEYYAARLKEQADNYQGADKTE